MLVDRQRGDTIIEVMLAFAIFSLVVVSTVTLMNGGMATAQRALELTLVRQQIDSQIVMLNNFKHNNPTDWQDLVMRGGVVTDTDPPELSDYRECPAPTAIGNSFFMAATVPAKDSVQPYKIETANFKPAVTFANVDVLAEADSTPLAQPKSYGVWTTLVRSEGYDKARSFDAHVRACWYSVGDKRPTVIATVVRVYDGN